MRLSLTILTTTTALSAFTSALSLWGGGGGSSSSNSNTRSDNPLSLQERASIWGLPDCASTCVTSSFGGCKSIDVECICKNTEFLSSLGCCMSKACDEADQQGRNNIFFSSSFFSSFLSRLFYSFFQSMKLMFFFFFFCYCSCHRFCK
jgi:hypothetical protein